MKVGDYVRVVMGIERCETGRVVNVSPSPTGGDDCLNIDTGQPKHVWAWESDVTRLSAVVVLGELVA